MKKLFFLFLLIPSLCFGATHYVDDDNNCDGSPCYTTVAAALTACSAGDTIIIEGGTDGIHREWQVEVTSTTKDYGALTIQGKSGTTVYWQGDLAAYASTGGSNWTVDSGTRYVSASSDFTGTDVYVVWYEYGGEVYRCKMETSKANVDADDEFWHDATNDDIYLRITDRGAGSDPDSYVIHIGDGGGTQDSLLSFNAEGTRDIDGITVSNLNFRYSSSDTGIIIYDGSDGTTSDVLNVTISNCTFKWLHRGIFTRGFTSGGVDVESPDTVTISDCTITDCGAIDVNDASYVTGALTFGDSTRNMTIEDSTIERAWRHGVSSTEYSVGPFTIRRCNISQRQSANAIQWHGEGSQGIRMVSNAARSTKTYNIYDNIITGFLYGIRSDNGSPGPIAYIEGNTICYNCQGTGDQQRNISLENNNAATTIKNNIIWGCDDKGASANYRREMHIATALTDGSQIDGNYYDSEITNDHTYDYPIYYAGSNYKIGAATDWLDVSIGETEIEGSNSDDMYADSSSTPNGPQFTDNQTDGSGNYHIASNSPGIEKALANEGSGTDIDGDTRDGSTPDIGADEYLADRTINGISLSGASIQ